MKKKAVCWGVALVLVGIIGFFFARSVVGWRALKHLNTENVYSGSVFWVTLEDGGDFWGTASKVVQIERLFNHLSETRVVPYGGEYDPFDESMMYFVFKYKDEPHKINRIGVTVDPVPLLTFGGEVYRISEEMAEEYRDIWENCRP